MKHIISFLLTGMFITLCFINLPAQEARQHALVVKKTATWCSNCGSWGWTWFKDLIADTQDDQVIAIALHSTASALEVPNNLDDDWLASFSTVGGFPTFYVNGTNHATYGSLLSNAKSKSQETPLAGMEVETGFDQNRAYARARITWQQAVSGEYALGFYMVEDSLVHAQTSQGPNALHRFVLRRSLGEGSFGELRTLDVPSGHVDTWESEQAYPLASTARHHVLTVLWRKVSASKYEYVNSALTFLEEGLLSGVQPTAAREAMRIFPNPVQRGGVLSILGEDLLPGAITASLYSPQGKLVFQARLPDSETRTVLLPAHLVAGSYVLTLRGNDGEARSSVIQILD